MLLRPQRLRRVVAERACLPGSSSSRRPGASCAPPRSPKRPRRAIARRPSSLELYCDRLARALANVVNLIDPHVIVLGGGLSKMDVLYRRVPELWRNYIFSESDRIVTRLQPPLHGDLSGVRGARVAVAGA